MTIDRPLLEGLFADQASLMRAFDVPDTREALVNAVLGLIEESVEVLRELRKGSTLPWRQGSADSALIFEESIDVLFFLLEVWILLGKGSLDVAEQYREKWLRNLARAAAAEEGK